MGWKNLLPTNEFIPIPMGSALHHFVKYRLVVEGIDEIMLMLGKKIAKLSMGKVGQFWVGFFTFASALGAENFSVKPERGEIMDFRRVNWRRLSPGQKRDWRVVLKENKK